MDFGTINICDHMHNYQYIVSHIVEHCLSFLHATTRCTEEGRANHSMMAQNWSPHECQKDIRGCFQKRSFASTPWMWFVNGATELGASCHRPALLQTSMAAVVLLVVRKLCLHISFSNCSAHSCVIMAPATGITWTAMNLAAGVYHQQNSNGSNFSQT